MSLLERFNCLTLADIEGFVARREPETLHLEFKTVSDETIAQPETRKKLAEVISGFANADGGLVAWGVDARKANGIDAANELRPLNQPEIFVGRVRALIPDATTPVVEGVHSRVLCYADGRGFVVTYVPASDGGPHLAKFSEDRYIRRSADRFVRMEHYEVADLFGRRRRPVLSLAHTLRFDSAVPVSRDAYEWRFELVLGIENTGRGTARAPYLALHVASGRAGLNQFGLTGNSGNGLPMLASAGLPGWFAFGGTMEMVVHPGTRHDVTKYTIRYPDRENALEDISLDYRLTAEGVSLTEGNLKIARDELLHVLPSR